MGNPRSDGETWPRPPAWGIFYLTLLGCFVGVALVWLFNWLAIRG